MHDKVLIRRACLHSRLVDACGMIRLLYLQARATRRGRLALWVGLFVGCAGPNQTMETTESVTASGFSTAAAETTASVHTGGESPTTGDAGTTGTNSGGPVDPSTVSSGGSTGGCGACPSGAPVCVEGACVECDSDDACPGGVCELGTHTCVECSLDADCTEPATPFCVDGDCIGCSEHAQCPNGACELDIGACFPNDGTLVLYSQSGQADTCASNDCLSADQPCCSVQAALDATLGPVPAHTHIIVHALKGSAPETVNVLPVAEMGDKHIAVLGEGRPEFADVYARPIFEIDHTAGKLFIAGVEIISGKGMAGVQCSGGALLWIDDSGIRDVVRTGPNQARGVSSELCDTVVRRSQLVGSEGGVIAQGPMSVRLVNTLIGDSPGGFEISTLGGPTITLLYTTVGDSDGGPGSVFNCPGDTTSITIRNSIVVSSGAGDLSIACMGVPLTVDRSIVSAPALVGLGEGNVFVDAPDIALPFVQWGVDLHLTGDGGPAAGAARWLAGDPRTDIDGELRPVTPGVPDVAGADLP